MSFSRVLTIDGNLHFLDEAGFLFYYNLNLEVKHRKIYILENGGQ